METWKKSRFAEPEIFLGFEIDLDFSRPCFSEIRVQIERPSDASIFFHTLSLILLSTHFKPSEVLNG